jgi:hypothetical protein
MKSIQNKESAETRNKSPQNDAAVKQQLFIYVIYIAYDNVY